MKNGPITAALLSASFILSFGAKVQANSFASVPTPEASATPNPTTLRNISARGIVMTGDQVLIGGFIITGDQPKTVVIRGLGPSLKVNNVPVPGRLANPSIRLMQGDTLIEQNDSWRTNEATVQPTGLAPENDNEAAMVRSLAPGNYTVILSGEGGNTGIGLVEIYDDDGSLTRRLGNISTRGLVQTNDNILIGGFIVGPMPAPRPDPAVAEPVPVETARVLVRALGPSLSANGAPIPNRLADPTLNLVNADGTTIVANDDWVNSDQMTEISTSGLAPTQPKESAVIADLVPGNYTAIVRGVGDSTGIGLVDVFQLLDGPTR